MELNKNNNLQNSNNQILNNRIVEEPQTLLKGNEEWIPFEKLGNISILCTTSRSTVYSAFWKDGPRKWDQKNEQYKRTGIQVTIKLYKDSNDIDQINEILNELKIYLDCHAQECSLLFQFYGISKQPDSNDYFAVKQFPQNGSLAYYISNYFNSLYWEKKLHLLLSFAEDLKALHDAGYVHRYLHPSSVLVINDSFCAIGSFSKCRKDLSNIEDIVGCHLTSLNSICIEFLIADNNEDYSKSNTQESITRKVENSNLDPLEMIKYIKENNLVKVFGIDELTMMAPIDNDHFCKISKATLKKEKTNSLVACKRFKSTQLDKTFFHELKLHKRLYFCLRVLRILGINLDENTKEYLLIMQYADGGNLRQYLKYHFLELTWDDKLKFAYQITEGIKYLHDEDVFHQNLHSKNIVIHEKEAKIMLDITKSTMSDYLNEMIPYVDPKILKDQSYEYNKKSDIYSLGVLIWELSSGKPPFIGESGNLLKYGLISGRREKPVPDTPDEYLKLYELCWDSEPSKRPSINQVFSKLGKILYSKIKKNLEPSELINLIENNHLTKIINIDELSNIEEDTTWKKKDCSFPVICKKYKFVQLNETFIHELKMHRKLNFCSRLIHILGISSDESVGECLLIMQNADDGNLRQYLENHFSDLTWDDKIKLAYQIIEGIKFLHDVDIIHQNLHSKNIVVTNKEAKIILDIVKCTEIDDYLNDYEMISYIDPKFLENHSYELDKKSDIYSLGVLMWELSSGYPPNSENMSTNHIIDGYRESRIFGTPKEYSDLYESCWYPEPNTRPSIRQVFNKIEEMNKELINFIIKYKLIKVINRDELSDMKNIDGGHFGIISRAIWKKTDNYVICKRLKNNESISNKSTEALLHELKMHGRLNFCQRIIRILGISLDEKTKEYLLIMQYADGGNLRRYLNQKFLELTWDDKIKLAYQITEGIKFLQGENILHRDLHSGGRREEPVPDTPIKYLKLYKSCWDPEPNARPSICQVFNKLVKLGRMMDIQDFQDIKCDDDMQDIQDDNNNDVNTQVITEENIKDATVPDDF
ncbi:unnamed protein product [Rhizophagus irregularis]|nr:unnamed protein product [Rhizophagus irregularis]